MLLSQCLIQHFKILGWTLDTSQVLCDMFSEYEVAKKQLQY